MVLRLPVSYAPFSVFQDTYHICTQTQIESKIKKIIYSFPNFIFVFFKASIKAIHIPKYIKYHPKLIF